MVGDRISAEVPLCYWQYPASRTGSHSEATLLTSDTLRFDCFVFRSSNSTLYNINTADMAYRLIWPYLIKMDSWFCALYCPTPFWLKLAVKACSHSDCKTLELLNEGYIYIYLSFLLLIKIHHIFTHRTCIYLIWILILHYINYDCCFLVCYHLL